VKRNCRMRGVEALFLATTRKRCPAL